ncbi:MAG: paraquat-inducible protein A [Rhodospirillales bacterium]|nr:paraquat-inducible protein A [Rhodospirillales bacterium]
MTETQDLAPREDWRECRDCGLFIRLMHRQPGLIAECPRCDSTLWRMRRLNINFPLACAIAGLFFYTFALIAPLLEVEDFGRFALAHLETGPVRLMNAGWKAMGILIFAVTLIAPGLKLGIITITLLGIDTRFPKRTLRALFRWYPSLSPWAMIDVYLLGFLVAYTRLSGMFTVRIDTALYALIGLMVTMAAMDSSLDQETVWRSLDDTEKSTCTIEASASSCQTCGLVNHTPGNNLCRRCDTPLYPRKPASISKTWAYIIAAAFLYIPANVYPFMNITRLARTQPYTIMGGIIELLKLDLWPLALLVFFASITIPLLKLIGLAYMLVSTQRGHTNLLQTRTKAYRVLDFIGRWSMIDIFMVSILVALVHFGQFANVSANIGSICFAAVVVLTIFAVDAFDPRLMWDNYKEPKA